jgi:hypothetical protein
MTLLDGTHVTFLRPLAAAGDHGRGHFEHGLRASDSIAQLIETGNLPLTGMERIGLPNQGLRIVGPVPPHIVKSLGARQAGGVDRVKPCIMFVQRCRLSECRRNPPFCGGGRQFSQLGQEVSQLQCRHRTSEFAAE